jgi:tripartite ATP-independent transporter DctM subunit
MDPIVVGIIGFILFLVLMLLGIPIPFAMLFVGVIGFSVIKTPTAAAQIMVADLVSNFSSYTLTVAPMFGLMGFLASYTGIGKSLIEAIDSYIGHLKGGLAMAVQAACAGFGAICGSIPATIGMMSSIAYPEMRKRNYSPILAGPAIASGATLAALIPPSLIMIIYGSATETSIGGLFLAGIFPGLLLMAANMLTIWFVLKFRHPEYAERSQKVSWKQRIKYTLSGGIPSVLIIFIISMGGLFAGFFTPTEAGAVGAFAMLIITVVTKQLNIKKFFDALFETVRLQAMVFMIMTCAIVFGRFLTISTIPTRVGNFVANLPLPDALIMGAILLFFIILGCFIDLVAMIVLTMPIFFPIVCGQLGYDSFWFGSVLLMLICIGSLTPPFGGNIFILKGCTTWDKEATLIKLFKGVWPFCICALICIIIMMAFPQIGYWLPHLIYG